MGLDYEYEANVALRAAMIYVNVNLPSSNIVLTQMLQSFRIEYKEIEMPSDMDGAFYRRDTGRHWIFVNCNKAYVRRRFSLGHEIGHFWLDHPSGFSLDGDRARWREVQANNFSSALLMPLDAVYKIHSDYSTIREIANWFRVSEISAAIRLMNLGLRVGEAERVMSDYYTPSDPSFYNV